MQQLVTYRRKREGKTNYKKRLIYLKSQKARLVVRKTNKQLILQLVRYEPNGDKIATGFSSRDLKKLGWHYSCNNLPSCYLAGLMLGKKAKDAKIAEAIVDTGLQTNIAGSRIYAAIKGAVDAGLKIPVSEEAFPNQDRINGKHISDYFKSSKEHQFGTYKQRKLDLTSMKNDIESLKKKILG